MSIVEAMLAEMEQEAAATKRLFERVPEDKLSWKPHAKSRTLGELAMHIAQVPGGVSGMVLQDSVEIPSFESETTAKSRKELMQTLDEGLAVARKNLNKMDDAKMKSDWSAKKDGQTVMTMPRAAFLRMVLLNHNYHHRGQLTVYLRMLNVPLPSVYGPSADENPFMGK